MLEKALPPAQDLNASLRERLTRPMSAPQAVRPLAPARVLTGGLVLSCAAVALIAAARVGFDGIERLGPAAGALILGTLLVLAWLMAAQFVAEMTPASLRRLSSGTALTLACAALLAVFAWLFRDYRTEAFIASGIGCLETGLMIALPAALLCFLWLRRGLALHPVSAGLAGGALAGLAGVALLELNCVNFQAAHVLVWHTAVIPVSAALAALLAWALRSRG
jgi:negative regulator of sigma F NrsF-like protein